MVETYGKAAGSWTADSDKFAHPDQEPNAVKRWGYWATAAWAVLALLLGQFISLAVVVFLHVGTIEEILQNPFDGALVALFVLISNPITAVLLWLAAWLSKSNAADYLGLHWTRSRYVVIGLVLLVALIALSDGLLYLSGRELVTSFQLQSYKTAGGWLVPVLIAAIIVAPAGEEIMFRGFLFRGFVTSNRSAWPAIIFISILWAVLHIQYDWAGMLQIFVVGLFLGWIRLISGSVLLTFLLHALFNLEGTLETVLAVKYFS
jgi:membrane protease YdiL (CAAX protease family)